MVGTPPAPEKLAELEARREALRELLILQPVRNSATALGLPPQCGSLRPLTQLWLASRVDRSPEAVSRWEDEAQWRSMALALRRERRARAAAGEDESLVRAEQRAYLKNERQAQVAVEVAAAKAKNARWWNRINPFYTPERPSASVNVDDDMLSDTIVPVDEAFIMNLNTRSCSPVPFTAANLGIQLQIIGALAPRIGGLAWRYPGTALWLAVYLAGVVATGILPSAVLWSSANVLNLVEAALGGKPATMQVALRAGVLATVLFVADSMIEDLRAHSASILSGFVSTAMRRVYITAKLDRAQHPNPDPVQQSVVTAAAIICGEVRLADPDIELPYDPWSMVSLLSDTLSSAVNVGAQLAMLFGFLAEAGHPGGVSDILNRDNAFLVSLSLAPVAIYFVHNWIWDHIERLNMDTPDKAKDRLLLDTVNNFIDNESLRNELVLFGLKDWTLRTWDKLQQKRDPHVDVYDDARQLPLNLFRYSADEFLRNAFYILLATHTVKTNLSLGSIHIHQGIGVSLIYSVKALMRRITGAYQVSFLFAGFFAAADGPETVRTLEDFEGSRVKGGMRIEARGLKYKYPEAEKAVLNGINLMIEPGESLAVVGFNGSGKTTLVKTLLGLHNHTGDVLINGRDITQFSPESLHARMSCLFQDYGKYSLSVRDNVGLGDIAHMIDDDAINLAIDRAGAQAIRDSLGLDTWLSMNRWLQSHNKSAVSVAESDKGDDDEDAETSEETGNGEGREEDGEEEENDDDDDTSDGWKGFTSTGLSGGQWQRIALARAFMRADTADLIVFDEPSASLDPVAEAELFDRIHSLSHTGTGATTIFISHRFNTVRRADKIAFVDKGRIIEFGNHAQLMQLRGKYFECFQLQRRGFESDEEIEAEKTPPTVE